MIVFRILALVLLVLIALAALPVCLETDCSRIVDFLSAIQVVRNIIVWVIRRIFRIRR
jgi:hypothetical protein